MSIVEEYMFKHPHEIMKLEDEYIELIVMALQEERKLWLMEYSREHNDYVVLQQENTKLKEQNEKIKMILNSNHDVEYIYMALCQYLDIYDYELDLNQYIKGENE